MQDVTDLSFWRVISRYGGADAYWTEYFRVHHDSRLDRPILESITCNPTGRPVVAQVIGSDLQALVRTVKELQQYPIAAVDLNLGCPAPVVCRKGAGGGLLRELERVDVLLGTLRDAVHLPFTVKTRVGFDTTAALERLLPMITRHSVDLLTVHGRTVRQGYAPGVRYDLIAQAAREVPCPVLANGDIWGPSQALDLLDETRAHGLMIGRGVIRNPWLFEQIRQQRQGQSIRLPSGQDVLTYIQELWEAKISPGFPERLLVQAMKKFMNFIGQGLRPSQSFLNEIRRAESKETFFAVCRAYLNHDQPMPLEPEPIS
jgi:tRNA-dihydrouridine synthase